MELGMRVQPVGGSAVAEKGQSIGIETGGQAILFQQAAQMDEVAPSGVAGNKGPAEDFPGMIVEGQNECGIVLGDPPRVRRGVVLPEFANGGALPAAARLGAAFECGRQLWELLPDIGGDGSAGTLETESSFQFIGSRAKFKGWLCGSISARNRRA